MSIPLKICGIRSLEAALFASELGVWALGFNFYKPSPRYIDPESARKIILALPKKVLAVGVFVNEDPEVMHSIREYCGLDYLQFSGDETAELREKTKGSIIQTLRAATPDDLPNDHALRKAEMILVDAVKGKEGLYGGTGRIASEAVASALIQRGYKVLFAGGITPDNAVERYQSCHPFGLDLASGVETIPGIKNYLLIQRLFQNTETL